MSKATSALAELRRAGAQGLPSESAVKAAKSGKTWSGKKKDGSPWQLKKNSEDSYNCMC